jgi:hypothetical protein
VHHTPASGPDGDALTRINEQIAALFVGPADEPLDAERLARYHALRDEYLAVRQGRARGREAEDDEEWAAA